MLDEAVVQYQKALTLNPEHLEAHANLARALVSKRKFADAIPHFQKALVLTPESADLHNRLGNALAESGRLDEATLHFEKALALNPRYAEAHSNLGRALVAKKQPDQAIPHFEKALEIAPGFADAHYQLGNVLLQQHRAADALAHWREALRIQPDSALLLNRTAWVLATSTDASIRNGSQAVDLAQRAVQLSGGEEPAILATLAASYAEAGQFSQAIEAENLAVDLATRQGHAQLAAELRDRLEVFQRGTPLRQQ